MKNQKGISLVEVLMGLAIFGIVGLAFLSGLSTTSRTLFITDEQETAKTLAETQMEYIKQLDYASSYSPAVIPPEYPGYTVKTPIAVESIPSRDGNIQKITIEILHNNNPVTSLESYKTVR